MSSKFQTIDRSTPYLLPPSLQDWLPENHLARFVVDMVDRLDLRELESRYCGGGKQPYHPSLLLALLFYGYATGVFSSRKLEQATFDSVAFRFITGDTHPDHDTIATFRKRFLGELEGLFVQLLVLAKVMGLLHLGHVSLDGTKIKANASKHKAMSWGYANKLEEQLRREVRELLKKAEQADAEDDLEMDIPDELARREDRLAAIEQAKAFFSYLPGSWRTGPPSYRRADPARRFTREVVPAEDAAGYDIHDVIEGLVDVDSFFESKPLFAPELVIGFGLLEGQQPHALLFNVQVEFVGHIVVEDHLVGEGLVLVNQRPHRVGEHLHDEAGESRDIDLDLLDLLFERLADPAHGSTSSAQRCCDGWA